MLDIYGFSLGLCSIVCEWLKMFSGGCFSGCFFEVVVDGFRWLQVVVSRFMFLVTTILLTIDASHRCSTPAMAEFFGITLAKKR